MANSKDGKNHKDKYFDTSRKFFSQEMTCAIWKLYYLFLRLFFKGFLKTLVKCQGEKIKYQQKDLVTRNIHAKYQSSNTCYSNVINKVKVFKK